jgi:hypothetical protein
MIIIIIIIITTTDIIIKGIASIVIIGIAEMAITSIAAANYYYTRLYNMAAVVAVHNNITMATNSRIAIIAIIVIGIASKDLSSYSNSKNTRIRVT